MNLNDLLQRCAASELTIDFRQHTLGVELTAHLPRRDFHFRVLFRVDEWMRDPDWAFTFFLNKAQEDFDKKSE